MLPGVLGQAPFHVGWCSKSSTSEFRLGRAWEVSGLCGAWDEVGGELDSAFFFKTYLPLIESLKIFLKIDF